MIQSRFWISNHPTPEKAWEAKKKLLEENPDKIYQVRMGKNESRIVFRLVERLKSNQAEVINESRKRK